MVFKRRADDWMANVPASVGHNNFDEVRVDFFRERITGFEAFKKGDTTFREEFTSKTWATEYNFPAVEDGRVVRNSFPDGRPSGAQGMFINTRRKKFADPRTRQALGTAFDFEWTNANIFYGLYDRTTSFFVNSDMMATGEPSPEELALLEPFRDRIAARGVRPRLAAAADRRFGPRPRAVARRRAASSGSRLAARRQQPRQRRRRAAHRRVPLRRTLLGQDPATLRDAARPPRRRGHPADWWNRRSTRRAPSRSTSTLRSSGSPSRRPPGESIREFWSSSAAKTEGSYNLAGISDPVVDALIETMINAPTREEMVTAARALDRVLRVGHYWVPQWYKGTHHVAYWDKFGIPDMKPRYDLPVATTWWAKDA